MKIIKEGEILVGSNGRVIVRNFEIRGEEGNNESGNESLTALVRSRLALALLLLSSEGS